MELVFISYHVQTQNQNKGNLKTSCGKVESIKKDELK